MDAQYTSRTYYPKMVERLVWLVRIEMPKELMNDVREGSIELSDQTIDLNELDDAYEQELDKEDSDDQQVKDQPAQTAAELTPGMNPLGAL